MRRTIIAIAAATALGKAAMTTGAMAGHGQSCPSCCGGRRR
jgi:hypothetical protein